MKRFFVGVIALSAFAYCLIVVSAANQMDAAGFNFRGEW